MFNKLIIFLMLFSFLCIMCDLSSGAFFLKRKKTGQPLEKIQKKEEIKKILLVQIYASWCPGCKNIQPTIDELLKESQDINYVRLDVSTPSKAQESLKRAKELKVIDFYVRNKSKTATVAIITPTTGEVISILENNNELEDYKEAIEKAKTIEKSLENSPA